MDSRFPARVLDDRPQSPAAPAAHSNGTVVPADPLETHSPDGSGQDRLAAPDGEGERSGAGHRVLRNSTFNLTAQGVYAVFHLVVLFTLARALDKEGLGEYYLLFALILVVQLIVEAGVGTVLTCRISQAPAAWRETVAEAAGLFAIIGLISAGVFLGLGAGLSWIRTDPGTMVTWAAAGIACAGLQAQRFAASVFRAWELFRHENLARILQGLGFAIPVVLLAGLGLARLETVLAMLALSHVLAALYLLGSLHRHSRCLACRLNVPRLRGWLGQSIPMGLGDLVRGLTWQIDTVLLGWLQPPAVVGIYSVAYRPLGPLNWLPRAVSTALFPSLARMGEGDRAGLSQAFSHSLRLLWIVSLPLAIGICMCAEPIILLLAGEEYLEAALPLRILIWITSLSFLSFPLGFLFAALGQQRTYARLVVFIFALEVGIELLLIPRWGYLGACAGSVLGEFVFTAVGLAICYQLGVGSIDWPAMALAVLAAAVMGVVLWLARELSLPLLLLAGAGSTGLYFGLCILFGALRWGEVRHFFQAFAGPWRPIAGRASAQ